MKKFQKLLGVFVFGLLVALLMPNSVSATEYEENLIKRIAPDGKNVTIKAVKPKNDEEVFKYINGVIQSMLNEEDYDAYTSCPEDVTKCQIQIQNINGGFNETYDVNITYIEPEKNEVIESYIDKYITDLKDFDWNVDGLIKVTDLGLINYYMTSEKSELWNPNAASRAIKYSNDIINITNGSNISFILRTGMGEQGEDLMYETAAGEMTILYNGYAYGGKMQGVYLRRVLYIPESTANTKEAYVAAAQKRIDDYLGKTGIVTVSYGGILTTGNVIEDSYVDVAKTDGNYYNVSVKVNDTIKTYPFYILKGTEEDLTVPTYIGSDIESNITITNNDPYIPLDTSLTVKNVTGDNIKKVLGTDKYKAFDIKLYSDGKGSLIEKSADKFLVRMPVPEEFEGKSLIVNYINQNNEKEPHVVTLSPDGKYLTFETDHFSTYILSENTNIKVPGTGDNILMYFIIGMISIVGFASTSIYLNKRYN